MYNAGGVMILAVIATVVGVFMTVISFVCMIKILQIAEDVRWMRSKKDSYIKPPMSYTNTLLICLGIAVGVTFLALFGVVGYISMLQGIH